LVRIPAAQTTNEFQPRNVGDSRIYGFELELRKSLKFIAPALQYFSVIGNYTFARSELKMNITEFNSRKGFEKVGETITDTREMAGQSPYIINAGLSYAQPVKGLEAGLYYNVKGRTLTVVGGGLFPDVYAQPFHSLNFNMNKSIGAARRANINFSVTNILNDQLEEFFVAFGAADRTFTRFIPATEIALGFGYQF
jgi:outer membrane receptor protein involved in Fe transport